MSFRITGLDLDLFRPLFQLDDAALAARGIQRLVAEPGWPDRITLEDARGGETFLLLPFEHQNSARSPYRASGPIFVNQDAEATATVTGEVPPQLGSRLLSLRAYDAKDEIVDAEVIDGSEFAVAVERLFGNDQVAYIHAHNARRGCYAARIDRIM